VGLVVVRLLEGVGILEVPDKGILLPVALPVLLVEVVSVDLPDTGVVVRRRLPVMPSGETAVLLAADTGAVVRLTPLAVGSGETGALLAAIRWRGELLTGVLVLPVPLALPLADIGVVLLEVDLGGVDLGGVVL